jgi:hypothetical protein
MDTSFYLHILELIALYIAIRIERENSTANGNNFHFFVGVIIGATFIELLMMFTISVGLYLMHFAS